MSERKPASPKAKGDAAGTPPRDSVLLDAALDAFIVKYETHRTRPTPGKRCRCGATGCA